MKIIQVISNISGTGATAYFMTLHHALKELGHDVCVYQFSNMDSLSFGTNDLTIVHKEFNQETYDELNSADIILIEGLPHKKESQEYKDAYLDMIQYHIKTKKALFIHSHIYASWTRANYSKRIATKDFLLSIDKICGFTPENQVMKKFASIIGKEELEKRFVHILLPHNFSKDLWIDAKDKHKKITYLGRLVRLKDPERLIEMSGDLWDNNWQIEMRGVVRSIGALGFKNLCYKWDEENQVMTNEPSELTCFVTGKTKEKYNVDPEDKNCINLTTNDKQIFVFGRYELKDGLEVMSHHSFGVDFFNLPTDVYGDTIEYAIYDIVNCGTIPVLDEDMAKDIHLYKNGKRIDKTLFSENAGIFVKKDLSNVNEAIEKMNYLYDNKEEYDKFRNNCYEIYKEFADPIEITKNLIEDIKNGRS